MPSPRTIFVTRLKNTFSALQIKYVRKHERFREVMTEMKNEVFFTFFGYEKVIKKLYNYRPRHGVNLETTHGPINSPN